MATRKRKATGPDRPSYLDHGDVDRVMSVLLALISEVAAIRERLDTHERISPELSPNRIEAYRADQPVEAERSQWRDTYIRRLFRVITEDHDALERDAVPNAMKSDAKTS